MNNNTIRNFGLDLFRTLAILLVVLSHGKFLLNGTVLENFPYVKMLDGVDLFFVLSGFLIGGILLKSSSEGLNWPGVAESFAIEMGLSRCNTCNDCCSLDLSRLFI